MKRKNIAIIYLLILSIGTILSLYIPKNEVTANEAVIIPSDAIRLRILANSDREEDQRVKRLVRDDVNAEITKWVSALTSKQEAKQVIQEGLPELQQIAENVLIEENMNQSVKVEFGKVDFPTKLYGEFLYPAGEYEAILITLGEGKGANWWCVLFPPLCFLDFSNGVAVSEGFDEKEEKKQEEEEKKKSLQVMKHGLDQKLGKTESPVFTTEDEEPVKVKFFIVEIWDRIFG
jgi:stage II sporulation protein R